MLDTIAIAENLTAAGVEQQQAKAHAQAIANAVGERRKEAATHSDLAGLKAEIAPNKAGIDALKWMVGVNLAITLALFAVVLAG